MSVEKVRHWPDGTTHIMECLQNNGLLRAEMEDYRGAVTAFNEITIGALYCPSGAFWHPSEWGVIGDHWILTRFLNRVLSATFS